MRIEFFQDFYDLLRKKKNLCELKLRGCLRKNMSVKDTVNHAVNALKKRGWSLVEVRDDEHVVFEKMGLEFLAIFYIHGLR